MRSRSCCVTKTLEPKRSKPERPTRELTLHDCVGACAIVSAWLTAPGAAAVITQSIPGLFRTTYTTPRTVQIPRFNPSLGNLQSATVSFSPEYSGTVGGTSGGSPNTANGWAIEFSGTLRLSGQGLGNLDFPLFNSRSGTVFQPGTPVFESFGPTALSSSTTFTSNLASYIGVGNTAASLSEPTFTADLFWSRSGSAPAVTRDLGASGGSVAYEYAVPEPTTSAALLGIGLIVRRRRRKEWAGTRRQEAQSDRWDLRDGRTAGQ